MIRAVLFLAALAAFAGLSSGAVPAMRYQGGYSCEGKIAKLDCYAPDGFVKALVYQNTAEAGPTAICDYPFINGGPAWGANALELEVDESIISVEACRGAFYGYTKVSVTTDKGKTWSCGGGSNVYPNRPPTYGDNCNWRSYFQYSCYKPYDYTKLYGTKSKWGSYLNNKYRGLLAAEDMAAESTEGRQLQADGGAESDTFWLNKNWGWGWSGGKSSCQVYRSPKQPKWSTCGGNSCNNWYSSKNRRWGSYGYQTNTFMYNKVYNYHNKMYQYTWGGKPYRYYQSESLYKKYTSYCAKTRCGYTPAYYYDENYPLASFSGICDSKGSLYNLYGFCWNKDYTPPSPPTALVVEMEFVSAPGELCVNFKSPILIDAVLGQIQAYISAIQPGLVKEIEYYSKGYKCTPGSGTANATTTVFVGFVPGANQTVQSLLTFFQTAGLEPGFDLCTLPAIPGPLGPFTPCVVELSKAIVVGLEGTGSSTRRRGIKKEVTVKAAMDNLYKNSQYAWYYKNYNTKKDKNIDKAYSSTMYGSAKYATAYISVFKYGYKKNMKKAYGADYYKKGLKLVKQKYRGL